MAIKISHYAYNGKIFFKSEGKKLKVRSLKLIISGHVQLRHEFVFIVELYRKTFGNKMLKLPKKFDNFQL